MASLSWTGNVSNDAANPQNWSGGVLPSPGDFLSITGGTVNVVDDEMADNTIYVEDGPSAVTRAPITFNINGNGFLDQNLLETTTSVGQLTWNVAAGKTWSGGYGSFLSPVTVNGPGNWENGMSGINGAAALINPAVIGTGQFYVLSASGQNGTLTFESSVAAGQAVAIGGDPTNGTFGQLVLDDPSEFQGSITIGYGEILINGVTADSYSYDGSTLSLLSGNNVVDTLRLTQDGNPSDPLSVSLTPTGIAVHTDIGSVSAQAVASTLQDDSGNSGMTFLPAIPDPNAVDPFVSNDLSASGDAMPGSGGMLFADPTTPAGLAASPEPTSSSFGMMMQDTPAMGSMLAAA